MSLAQEESLCCGCTACESICPFGGGETPALKMEADDKGFLYPKINEDVCISCHACERVCFYQSGIAKIEDQFPEPIAFAVKAKEETLRQHSQSGGAFGVFAHKILVEHGIVYGAAFDQAFIVKHRRITKEAELVALHGSKYVQSDLRKIYTQVKQDLNVGKRVLFSGTPCQVMGLRKFLQHSYDNLLMVDIICYGVPSPTIWRDFLGYFRNKSYGSLQRVEHRAKNFGWHVCRTRLTYDKKVIVTDGWTRLWGSALPLRPSCHDCKFTNLSRPGDLTVGDCWGAEKKMPDFDDNKGISLLLVNTEKGKEIWQNNQEEFTVRSINIKDYLQPRLSSPTPKPEKKDIFWSDYHHMSRKSFIREYAGFSMKQRMRRKLAQFNLLRKIYQLVRS